MKDKNTVRVDEQRSYSLEKARIPKDSNRHLMQCTKCKDHFVVILSERFPDLEAVRKVDGVVQRVYRCPHGCRVQALGEDGKILVGKDGKTAFVYAPIVPFTRHKETQTRGNSGKEEEDKSTSSKEVKKGSRKATNKKRQASE